jgi:hypothetical protein
VFYPLHPHPVSQQTARCFHRVCVAVGVAHVIAGLCVRARSDAAAHLVIGTLMIAFHGVSQRNHEERRRAERRQVPFEYGYGSDWMGVC